MTALVGRDLELAELWTRPTNPVHALSEKQGRLVAGGQRVIVVCWHPSTAEISQDFSALKLEPFLEPRAFLIWNRREMTTENSIKISGRGEQRLVVNRRRMRSTTRKIVTP
jgi:hypothetical protein